MPNAAYRQWRDSGALIDIRTWHWRKRRRAANKAMRAIGVSVPRELYVHYVRLTKTPLPVTVKSLARLSRGADCAWIYSLRKARALVEADRAAGGEGTLFSYEYQKCLVCGNVLIGPEAKDYRERRRWPRSKCYWPWGPQCSASCKPDDKRAAEAIKAGQTRYERNLKEWSA